MSDCGYGEFSICFFSIPFILIWNTTALLFAHAEYPHIENHHANNRFDCPDVQLPDHVDYVVAIGGIPGGGGRTVVRTLELLFNMDFGQREKDLVHRSLDNRWFIFPGNEEHQGATDIGNCKVCEDGRCKFCHRSDWQARFCAVQKVIGPMGSSPDNYNEDDRERICEIMGTMTSHFRDFNFGDGQRIWIFKYAETIMFLPLLERVWGDRFRFILNVRNPVCQHRFGYFDEIETLECFHPRKDIAWKVTQTVDKQLSKLNPQRQDLFHVMTFHDLLMPTWNFLHREMRERFIIIRHEDLLTEEGIETFAYDVENLLNIRKVDGRAKEIASEMAQHSRDCDARPIPELGRKSVQQIMGFFNYTGTYYNPLTLLKSPVWNI